MSTNITVPTVKSVIDGLVGDAETAPLSREKSGYDLLDRKGKAAVKSGLEARLTRFIAVDGNLEAGKRVMSAQQSVKGSASPVAKVVTESDVLSGIAHKVAMLRFAADALVAGNGMITGTDIRPDSDKLDELDIPDLTDEERETALKFATVAFGAKRKENDVPTLIHRFIATVPEGAFVKVRDIRVGIGATSGISVDSGWDGRINAFLFNLDKDGHSAADRMEGVEPVKPGHSSYTDRNGLVRVAGFESWESDNMDDSDSSDDSDNSDQPDNSDTSDNSDQPDNSDTSDN